MSKRSVNPSLTDASVKSHGLNLNSIRKQVEHDAEEALLMLNRAGIFSTVERYKLKLDLVK